MDEDKMTESPPPATAPMSRKAKLVLTLSLALNLLVLGLVGGAILGGHGPMMERFRSVDVGFGPLTDALSRQDRRDLFRQFLRDAPDFRAERQAARQDFSQLAAGLRADPWNRGEAEAILARQGDRGRTRLEAGERLMLDHIQSMTPDERRAFADRIEQALMRKGPEG